MNTQPKPEILAAVWQHYKTNAAQRTASKPYRGENWACTLLAFGVPESDLLPADQGRGLKPMTSASAMTRNWWKWKKVYGPELKRLEEANGPPDNMDRANSVAGNTDAPSMDAQQHNDGERDRDSDSQDGPEAHQGEPVKAINQTEDAHGSDNHSTHDNNADSSDIHASQGDSLREGGEEPPGVSAQNTEDHSGGSGAARPPSAGAGFQLGGEVSSVGGADSSVGGEGVSGNISAEDRADELERSREATKRHAEIIAESRADAKMWPVVDYPNRDAVELGEPRYWILWYDPQFDPKERWDVRGRVRNWDTREMERMFQSPWQLRPEHIYDGHIKVKFSNKYEENRGFDTEGAMLLEEWEDLMGQSPEGKKYLAAQDENNMPLPNIPVNRSWGRSGRGKDKEMYVDEYGYVWDREADMKAGEPPLHHVVDGAFPSLQERLRPLFPTPPDNHPGL